jgi:hypothetical protein
MLTWNAIPQAKFYAIERSLDAVEFETVGTTPDTSAIDNTLEPGMTYIYRLRASLESESQVSEPVILQASARAVDRLDGFGDSPQSIVLEWRDVIGEKEYRVERSSDGKEFQVVASVPQNSSGYRDAKVEPGRSYVYRVATVNSLGNDAVSKPVPALSGITGLSAAALDHNRVVLNWPPSHPQARLFVERLDRNEFVTIGALDGTSHEFIDGRATPGSHLQYRVVAVEDSNEFAEIRKSGVKDIGLPDWVSADHFALRFTGKIRIAKSGKYNFYLNSDDGSRLFVDGSLVVDNDGRHKPEMVCGTIRLTPGIHDLEVQYFEHDGGNALQVWWSGPGAAYGIIPDSAYSSLVCHYYEGTWWRLPFGRAAARSQTVTVKTPAAPATPNVTTTTLLQSRQHEAH